MSNIIREKVAARVTILDAKQLDVEIHEIIKNQLATVTSYLPPGTFANAEPELETILKIALWVLSVGAKRATFGQQLLSLKYNESSSAKQLHLYGIFLIALPYLRQKLDTVSMNFSNQSSRKQFQSSLHIIDSCLKLLNILSFVIFLRTGKASTFGERLFGLYPVSVAKASRVVGYSFMTRELLWHGFIEMVMSTVPLFSWVKVRRKFVGLMRRGGLTKQVSKGPSAQPNPICSICHETPILPHHMGCPHTFCYYCLSVNREEDSKFECPECFHSDPNPQAVKRFY